MENNRFTLRRGIATIPWLASVGTFGYFSIDAFKEVLRPGLPIHSILSQPDFGSAVWCALTAVVCAVAACMTINDFGGQ